MKTWLIVTLIQQKIIQKINKEGMMKAASARKKTLKTCFYKMHLMLKVIAIMTLNLKIKKYNRKASIIKLLI